MSPRPVKFTAFGRPGDFALSVSLRGFELLFTIISLGTSAGAVPFGNSAEAGPIIGLVVSILTLFYIVGGFTIHRLFTPIFVLVTESVLTVLWLVAFAVLASDFAQGSCSFTAFDDGFFGDSFHFHSASCGSGKAAIAFTFLTFLLFVVTLVLHVVYAFYPYSRVSGAILQTRTMESGGIFPVAEIPHLSDDVGAAPADLENHSVEKPNDPNSTVPVASGDTLGHHDDPVLNDPEPEFVAAPQPAHEPEYPIHHQV